MSRKNQSPIIHRPKSAGELRALQNRFDREGFVAMMPGSVRSINLGGSTDDRTVSSDAATSMRAGHFGGTFMSNTAFAFDAIESVNPTPKDIGDPDLGYVKWGAADNIPNQIPQLLASLPYTAAARKYIIDLFCGLGIDLMYRDVDDRGKATFVRFGDMEQVLKRRVADLEAEWERPGSYGMQEELVTTPLPPREGQGGGSDEPSALKDARSALAEWQRTWYGYDTDDGEHVPGAQEFLEENNLDLHLAQCAQDFTDLDICYPTVGFQRGRVGEWHPKIVRCGFLASHSTRLEQMNEFRHINHIYFSDDFRVKGKSVSGGSPAGTTVAASAAAPVEKDKDGKPIRIKAYPAAMPQSLLGDLRYIVTGARRSRIKDRPTWVCCPTFRPSLNKPYYPQPEHWSIFSSGVYDYAATIVYDKKKGRDNATMWGKILYISMDYLEALFAREGAQGDKARQDELIAGIEQSIEEFLQRRENNGKMMRQFMWTDPQGHDHKGVEIVDVTDVSEKSVSAGKEELELVSNIIFLSYNVDPRLVGVPIGGTTNGGTAQRELHLLKQQQLAGKQTLLLRFYDAIARFNQWDPHACFKIRQQTLTTLDNSKTGTVETISGEEA